MCRHTSLACISLWAPYGTRVRALVFPQDKETKQAMKHHSAARPQWTLVAAGALPSASAAAHAAKRLLKYKVRISVPVPVPLSEEVTFGLH